VFSKHGALSCGVGKLAIPSPSTICVAIAISMTLAGYQCIPHKQTNGVVRPCLEVQQNFNGRKNK